MAQRSPSHPNIDLPEGLGSSQSELSYLKYDNRRASTPSLHSSMSSGRRANVLGKLGSSFRSVLRRITGAPKQLSDMEIEILLSVTNFTHQEILEWHEKFLQDCPYGYMTRKQFIGMYKNLCPNGNPERFASHVFRAFDLDKSKAIDFREFLIGISMTSRVSSPETKLQWIFQVFDINGDGLLSRNECLEVIDAIVRFNQAQSGEQTQANVDKLVMLAKRSMMTIFDNASLTRSNSLTMLEFVEGCKKDELITQLLAATPPDIEQQSTVTTQSVVEQTIPE